jgi:hypothetical protein
VLDGFECLLGSVGGNVEAPFSRYVSSVVSAKGCSASDRVGEV